MSKNTVVASFFVHIFNIKALFVANNVEFSGKIIMKLIKNMGGYYI